MRNLMIPAAILLSGCSLGDTATSAAAVGAGKAEELRQGREKMEQVQQQIEQMNQQAVQRLQDAEAATAPSDGAK